MTKSCFNCKHYHQEREEESWEMSHIWWWDRSCTIRPQMSNLKNFPFEETTCKQHEPIKDKNDKHYTN